MGYKRGNKGATPVGKIDKTPVAPIPANLENEVIQKTEELVEEAEVKEEVFGIVDGVAMALNIRKDPEVKPNNQIAILGKGTKIIVIDAKKPIKNKDGEWYKIRVIDKDPKDPASNGYAMKKYITII